MDVKELSIKASLSPEDRAQLVQEVVAALLPHLTISGKITPESNQEPPISKREACRLLTCSEPTMTKWMSEGKIPFGRKGRRVYFFKSQVLKSLEQPLRRA